MRLRRITAAQTRTAILDAVHALLAASDAGRLTLDEVARKAGVTRATVYNQFGSRQALLTSISHDLRTPLAVVTGAASTLLDDRIEPLVRKDLTDTILKEAEQLERRLQNLLDMTRVEGGALRVRTQWQPLEEVVGTALRRMDGPLSDREVTVTLPALAPAASVPNAAIKRIEGTPGVWAIDDDALRFAPVKLGAADLDGRVQIVEGLEPGERVVLYSLRALGPRNRIKIVESLPGVLP